MDGAKQAIVNLDKYRKVRIIAKISQDALTQLKKDSVDVDLLLDTITDEITKSRAKTESEKIWDLGSGDGQKLIDRMLAPEENQSVGIGIKDTVGEKHFYRGSLVILGAYTSSGKSAMANQILMNVAQSGHKVAMVSLEMTETENMARISANLAEIDVSKILGGDLTKDEQGKIKRRVKRFEEKIAKKGGMYSLWSPSNDVSIEDVLWTLKPKQNDVILIDYISLLRGGSDKDYVVNLGNIARSSKVFAKSTNSIVILLAQIDESERIKYARSIKEHANNAWVWTMTDKNKEDSVLEIKELKARNSRTGSFFVSTKLEYMQIYTADLNSTSISIDTQSKPYLQATYGK